MARRRIWGAEMGDFSDVVTTSGTVSVVSSPVNTGGYALRCNPTTTGTGYAAIKPFSATGGLADSSVTFNTMYAKFRFRYATKPASGSEEICEAVDGGRKAALRLTSAGKLDLYDSNNSLKASGTTVLSADTWYTLYLKVGTDSAGGVDDSVYELKIDGVSEYSGTDLNGSSLPHTGLFLGKASNSSSQSVDYFYDDVIIDDASYPGDSQVQAMQPDSAGTYSGATAGSYADVDELPHDGDTTYLTWTNTAAKHSANLESSASAGVSGTVACVQTYGVGRDNSGSSRSLFIFQRSGTTDTDSGTGVDVGGSYQFFGGKCFEADPSDSAAWTTTKLDSLQVGAYLDSSSSIEHRVTAMGVMVEFVPPAPAAGQPTMRRFGGIDPAAFRCGSEGVRMW